MKQPIPFGQVEEECRNTGQKPVESSVKCQCPMLSASRAATKDKLLRHLVQ